MRILVDYRPALRHRTGVGEYVHQMAAALAALLGPADSLTLFSSSLRDRLGESPVPGAAAIDRRVPVRVLNLLWHRVGWPRIETVAGSFDVVQSAHPLLIPARRGVRAILVADLDFLDHPERTRAEIRRDYASLAPAHVRMAHVVVTISEYTAGRIRERFDVPVERIVVCHPGAPGWQPRRSAGTDGPILFLGTIEPRKNLPVLFRAYADLVERHPGAPPLLLAGGRGEGGDAILEELRHFPRIGGRVLAPGYVSDDERRRLYGTASMLVLPSLDEGFGMTALEAMAVGVPVVVSNAGALPEVVGNAGFLVDPRNAEAFASAMESLLVDEAIRAAFVAAGLARATRFSWRASAERLLRAYRSAAGIAARGRT